MERCVSDRSQIVAFSRVRLPNSFHRNNLTGPRRFRNPDRCVSDPTGAVVPNAKIMLTDSTSGSARDTVSDGAGYYTFASVPVGTYNLAVAAGGFKDYAASNITLGGGEKRNVNVT